jgi:hypothetical protein
VGEGNKPELLSTGGKMFLIPGSDGNVIPNNKMAINPVSAPNGGRSGGDIVIRAPIYVQGATSAAEMLDSIQNEAKRRGMKVGFAR